MRRFPETAVVVMDVVMEGQQAGLEAVECIRQELNNSLVRILLHTGQPGVAPEREVIVRYDIDDYLAKPEMTSNRLFVAVRTALKSYQELRDLQKHRDVLDYLHRSVLNLHSAHSMIFCLNQLMDLAADLLPSRLTWLYLDPADEQHAPHLYYRGDGSLSTQALSVAAADLLLKVRAKEDRLAFQSPCWFEAGFIACLELPEGLGRGFLYVERRDDARLMALVLPIMVSHAVSALQMLGLE